MTSQRRTRVLFLHHSGALDGSLVSLRELLRLLDRERFEPVVALLRPGDGVRRALEEVGVRTLSWPGISALNHATAFWSDPRRPHTWPPFIDVVAQWRASVARTLGLVAETRPDVVHVNSVILAPCADALRRAHVPFVWHVREMPAHGVAGLRLRFQRRALVEWPDEIVFLSELARREWIGGARGLVIPELVDPGRFSPALDARTARRELGVAEDDAVALYLGGMARIKGFEPLIRAIPIVAWQVPRFRCLMPGTQVPPAPADGLLARAARRVGVRSVGERLERAFERSGALPWCVRLPFSDDIPLLTAASDILVFPATEDHFPRPVVEAGVMEKPIVASSLPAIREALGQGDGGLLVPPDDPGALAAALVALLRDPALRARMGKAGRVNALRRFDARANAAATMDVYDRLIHRSAIAAR